VVALVGMLADGGLGISLVKEPESSPVWATAFWALLGAGVALALGLAGAGIVLGEVLHQPRIPGMVTALSITIVLMAVTVPPVARLDRQGRIAVGAFADLTANVFGTATGLVLAVHGAGAWSLVGQYTVIYFIRAVVVNCAAFKLPAWEFRPGLLISHLSTGGLVLAVRISDFAGRMTENLVLTRWMGPAALGLYSFSNQISRFVTEAASNPLWLSLYIRALHEEREAVASLHRQFLRLLGMLLFPATALFLASAERLVPMLLGPKWVSVTPMLQILLPGYALAVLGSQSGAVLLARGRYDIQLYGTIGLSLGKVGAVCLAPWLGLVDVAYLVSAINGLYALTMILLPSGITGQPPRSVLNALLGPLAGSALAGMICWVLVRYSGHDFGRLVLCVVVSAGLYGLLIILLDRKNLLADLDMLGGMFRARRATPAT
jgi:PST family polysaccharide transporter